MEQSHFSSSYFEARARFRDLASKANASVTSFHLPLARDSAAVVPEAQVLVGVREEALTMDVAWLGAAAPRAALIVTSGTHGVEGFAGSGFQCSLLAAPSASWLDADTAVILVHALNPFGFAHVCRTNESNIDLNRNFIDFTRLPASPGYDVLHAAIVPSVWSGEVRARADRVLGEAWETLGERGFQQAVCLGQHTHADGLFYGGDAPSWSNSAWHGCLARLPRSIVALAHIDIHTGLGPYGYGELIYSLPASDPAHALAKQWYAGMDLCTAGSADSAATAIGGTMNRALLEANLDAALTSISIEFGTVDFRRMFEALRADNWLRTRAPPAFAAAADIRRELLSCFFPDDSDWDEAVLDRCRQVFMRTLAGLKQHLRA